MLVIAGGEAGGPVTGFDGRGVSRVESMGMLPSLLEMRSVEEVGLVPSDPG